MIIKDKEQGELLLPLYNPSLWSSENEVRFRETFTDTIYTVKNRKLYPYMVFIQIQIIHPPILYGIVIRKVST